MKKIPLSFLPPPTAFQGGPVERGAELWQPLFYLELLNTNLNIDHRTWESKVALFCEKSGGICMMVSKNIYTRAYKLLTEVEKK